MAASIHITQKKAHSAPNASCSMLNQDTHSGGIKFIGCQDIYQRSSRRHCRPRAPYFTFGGYLSIDFRTMSSSLV